MNKLKELRKLHNVSREELSKKLSVTEKTISRWENEKTQIKPDKAQKLADYFNVSVGYLLGYESPKCSKIKKYITFQDDGYDMMAVDQLNNFIDKNQNLVIEVENFQVVRYETLNLDRIYILASYKEE